MEVIDGQFYMKCCDEDDPNRLHTPADLKKLVKKIGFLPLFSNTIPGFSAEERTIADYWWSGNEDKDPWDWRRILSEDNDIAYGKFFNKKAGYISKKWFPVLANYRRRGYDFEALVGDELASYRARKIMTAMEYNEQMQSISIPSYELKAKAGFGKNGEKNFDGIMTDLQMQTYLIMSSFKQKVNKKGEAYGWHIAVFETPETKWGYEYVGSCYNEEPEDSWKKIVRQVTKFFPEADEREVTKLLK